MSSVTVGPRLQYSEQLHAAKYRVPGESFRDAMNRVAGALQDSKEHYHEFREILLDMRFLPAGRVQSAMGAPKMVTPYNCFLGGRIPDSFTMPDNPEQSSIMHRALEAAQTMRLGGGLGNDFSTLRPKGARIGKINSTSTGPVSFMGIFNEVGNNTSSTGERRGAQMGVLRIDHPDIREFINAKHDNQTLKRFNISVGVTDAFMEALARKGKFDLKFGGEVYETVDAAELWETLMRSTWDFAEPGVIYVDRMNYYNNLYYCERLEATNPCAEQPLPAHGACLLGSYNLTRYVRQGSSSTGGLPYFDWTQLLADIPPVVRAMDNIVDRALYPLPQQAEEARSKRRMGLGVTGFANVAEALGYPYGTPACVEFEHQLLGFLTHHIYVASTQLAAEKGAFPLYDEERYLAGQFIQTLDPEVRELIARHGIRNSHLTSIAPTGTISMTADNVSSSVEPVYQWESERPVELPGGTVQMQLHDYGFREFQVRGRRAGNGEVSVREHVDVLVAAQSHVDSAVSKTVNTDGNVPWEDFKRVYTDVYDRGGKGCTTFNRDGKRFGLFKMRQEPDDVRFPDRDVGVVAGGMPDGDACTFDVATGRRTCE